VTKNRTLEIKGLEVPSAYESLLLNVAGVFAKRDVFAAKIEVLEDQAFALAHLKDSVGKRVTLDAISWSLNNEWWIRYRGIDIGLKNFRFEEHPSLSHAGRSRFSGILSYEKFPDIRQISLKANRDMVETYLLALEKME
jgi:hypothetical protein